MDELTSESFEIISKTISTQTKNLDKLITIVSSLVDEVGKLKTQISDLKKRIKK